MPTTAARLLELLSLLQARRSWSGPDLARQLGVDVRTLRRDVGRLRDLGYPVDSSSGVGGAYRLGAGSALPPLMLSDDEAVTMALGLLAAAHGAVAGAEVTSLRAFAKLDKLLPARLRRRVQALQQATARLLDRPGEAASPEVLVSAALACSEHERLAFDYLDAKGRSSRRTVEPCQLVAAGRRWYLLAWDLDRGGWRTYRADRMRAPVATGPRFVARPLPRSAAEMVQHALASAPYRHQARLLIHAPAAEVEARTGAAAGRVEALGDGRCLLHAGAHDLEALALHVALKGFDFEVLEPVELRAALRTVGRRCLRASRPPSGAPAVPASPRGSRARP